MANIYVRSTDGSDADNGSTWALAKATLMGAAAIDAAGDTIWLSQSHAESGSDALTFGIAGTNATPSRILCGNDAAGPPTSLTTGAKITTTATTASALVLQGSGYMYGVHTVVTGGTAIGYVAGATPSMWMLEQCILETSGTGSGGHVQLAGAGGNLTKGVWARDCQFKFANSANYVKVSGMAKIEGGSIVSGSSTPTELFRFAADRENGLLEVSGFDFSNLSAGVHLFSGGTTSMPACRGVVRNCKLPASWSGGLVSSAPGAPGQRYELWNCAAGDTNYAMWVEEYQGSIRHETTIVRTGGASDGDTALSWKMATTANAEYPLLPLVTPEILRRNTTTGSAITVTVEVVTDNVTLTDTECWLDVQYLGTSGYPLALFVDDAAADVLATPANQASSTETWTTTGLTTPVKQKLSVTFTPQEKGMIYARVMLAKASTTVYVCPKLTVS